MDSPPEAPPVPLPYARQAKWHLRRRFRVVLFSFVLLSIVLVGTFAWIHYGPWLRSRLAMRSAQRACLDFQPLPDAVIYQQDGTYAPGSPPWKRFASMKALPTWDNFQTRHVAPFGPLAASNLQSQGTLFLHERRSPAGNRRLVAVDLRPIWNNDGWWAALEKRAVIPGTLRTEPRETWAGPPAVSPTDTNLVGQRQDLLNFRWSEAARLYAGRADPGDPSHFTIDYEIDGRGETIDGWLRDNDAVDLALRNPADANRPR